MGSAADNKKKIDEPPLLYVSYSYSKMNASGFGWIVLKNTPAPKTVKQIESMIKKIVAGGDPHFSQNMTVIPINWRELV